MKECNCPQEEKPFYNLMDTCVCQDCDIDVIDGTPICRKCKLVKPQELNEHDHVYDEEYPYIERYNDDT